MSVTAGLHKKARGELLISQNADDTSFILYGTQPNFTRLVALLARFDTASGLYTNWEKSLAYWLSPDPGSPKFSVPGQLSTSFRNFSARHLASTYTLRTWMSFYEAKFAKNLITGPRYNFPWPGKRRLSTPSFCPLGGSSSPSGVAPGRSFGKFARRSKIFCVLEPQIVVVHAFDGPIAAPHGRLAD